MKEFTPFLRQVASHYTDDIRKEMIGKTCFVFPSRRALLHFRNEVKGIIPGQKITGTTVNDFFYRLCSAEKTDRIRLVLELYESYRKVNPQAESLDDFIFWGNIMIGDFDNLDKYMVEAKSLFVNVSDLKSIQDTLSYLTEGQRLAIERFLAHFRNDRGRLTAGTDGEKESKDMKRRFLQVWDLLYPLYEDFKGRLQSKQMSYEGMVYRTMAQRIKNGEDIRAIVSKVFPWCEQFVFVGLNALCECEKTVLRALRDKEMAQFAWDFSSREIRDPRNKASLFLQKNISEFPQSVPIRSITNPPQVTVVSIPSGVGQTKLAGTILSQCEGQAEQTALVLPDEGLLMPLLSAIPESYETVNITMGYPFKKSGVYALMKAVGAAQIGLRTKEEKSYFPYKNVSDILFSSLVAGTLSDQENEVVLRIKSEGALQIVSDALHGGPMLDAIFEPLRLNLTAADPAQNDRLAQYLDRVVLTVGAALGQSDVELVEMDFAKRYHEAIEQIRKIRLAVKPSTYLTLLDRLLSSESVPFEGEPLKGLQVMGTLETRALDFRNVVIFSANEDVFPHRSVDNSFIPPELRKAFGMPTLEYQDAVWTYYFYRLIQRAEKVWMIYDSRTEGVLSGEESRYIKQLEYHFEIPVRRISAASPVSAPQQQEYIPKTQEDIDALRNGHLSASSLQSYLTCPAKFYYQAVKGLKTEDEVNETLDAATLGTVFHSVMQKLYSGRSLVSASDISLMLIDEQNIRSLIQQGIMNEMHVIEVTGRNLIIEEVIYEYVMATLRHDKDLLMKSGSKGFRILGLERFVKSEIEGFPFIGFIDRIDTFEPGRIRIVDYKTGHVENEDIRITDENAQAVADKLFGESNTGRPKIALQLYLYGRFAHEDIVKTGETVVNSVYSTGRLLTSALPDVEESKEFTRIVGEKLKDILAEIADTSIPFKKTCDKRACSMCDFRSICGR